jgi:hypothetical protein
MSPRRTDKEVLAEGVSPWLDTETKAMLQQVPPEKYAPSDTDTFTLVLLRKGDSLRRLAQALEKVPGLSSEKAESVASSCCPLPVARGLSLYDALLGQFELVCCDSVSVFLRDGVVWSAAGDYLARLYPQFELSPEFETVSVNVGSIPRTEQGERIVRQFFGGMEDDSDRVHTGFSFHGNMMRKKARIMAYWAKKLGAEVTIADSE